MLSTVDATTPYNHTREEQDLHKSTFVACGQLLVWLFLRPSSWHAYTHQQNLPSDFALTQINRQNWQNNSVRRLITVPFSLPIFVSICVGWLLWLFNLSSPHLIFGVSFSFLFSLFILLVVGAVVSWGMGIVGSVTIGLFGGVNAALLVKAGVGLQSYINGLNTQTIITQISIGLTFGIIAGVAPRIAKPVQNSAPTRATAVAGIIIGVFLGLLFGIWGLMLIRPCPPQASLYGLLGCGPNDFIDSNWATQWIPFILITSTTIVLVGWKSSWRQGLLWGSVFGVLWLLFTQMTTPNQLMRWALKTSCDDVQCFGFSQLYYATVTILFGTALLGSSTIFNVAYVIGQQLNGAKMGAFAGIAAVFVGMFSWVAYLLLANPIHRLIWTLPILKTASLLGGALLIGFTIKWWRPMLFYLPSLLWNRLLLWGDQHQMPTSEKRFLRNAVFWDEGQYLPLFGLVEHLILLHDYWPQTALSLQNRIAQTKQKWAADVATRHILARQLTNSDSVTAVADAYHHIQQAKLTSSLWKSLSHLSQDCETALNQGSVYHQRLLLRNISEQINQLQRELATSSDPDATSILSITESWQQTFTQYEQALTQTADSQRKIDNPYIFGVPLTEQQEIFVGRTEISDQIEQLLLDQRRPPLFLHGQRRMGKTSLLRNLGRLLPLNIVPMFVDGEGMAGARDMAGFLYSMARQMIRSAQQQRALTLPAIQRDALCADPFISFNEWLDAVEDCLAQTQQGIGLLMIDEFEAVSSLLEHSDADERDFMRLLRHLIQHRTQFKVLLASSHSLDELSQWAGYLLNVKVVKIGSLSPQEARQLIQHPIPQFPLQYQESACTLIEALTNRHPYLLQLLCYEIVVLKNSQPPDKRFVVEVRDVETAVPFALQSGTFFFTDIEQNQVSAAGLAILQKIARADAPVPLSSFASLANGALNTAVSQLLHRDLIQQTEAGLSFQTELIKKWFAP